MLEWALRPSGCGTMRAVTTHHRRAQPAARARGASRASRDDSRAAAVPTAAGGVADWASVIGVDDSGASARPTGSEPTARSTGPDAAGESDGSSGAPAAAVSVSAILAKNIWTVKNKNILKATY